jgi:hypothetical protein
LNTHHAADGDFSGHTQVSTVIGNDVFATSESMELKIGKMDELRPKKAQL